MVSYPIQPVTSKKAEAPKVPYILFSQVTCSLSIEGSLRGMKDWWIYMWWIYIIGGYTCVGYTLLVDIHVRKAVVRGVTPS